MVRVVFSVFDPARVQPVRDPDAHLQAAVHGHVSPETVLPHWLKRTRPADASGASRLAKLPAHRDCHVAQGDHLVQVNKVFNGTLEESHAVIGRPSFSPPVGVTQFSPV
jgi:hypothetical protein